MKEGEFDFVPLARLLPVQQSRQNACDHVGSHGSVHHPSTLLGGIASRLLYHMLYTGTGPGRGEIKASFIPVRTNGAIARNKRIDKLGIMPAEARIVHTELCERPGLVIGHENVCLFYQLAEDAPPRFLLQVQRQALLVPVVYFKPPVDLAACEFQKQVPHTPLCVAVKRLYFEHVSAPISQYGACRRDRDKVPHIDHFQAFKYSRQIIPPLQSPNSWQIAGEMSRCESGLAIGDW